MQDGAQIGIPTEEDLPMMKESKRKTRKVEAKVEKQEELKTETQVVISEKVIFAKLTFRCSSGRKSNQALPPFWTTF